MDFLDPRKRRSHSIRLMIGYILMAIAIGLGTIVLVYGAYGYGIDTKTGQITENGLLFVDSKPGGAKIFLNGKDQNSTSAARLILPSGDYELTLKKDGYKDWKRSFTLLEHSIERYVYPFLFPAKFNPEPLKRYPAQTSFITVSPDRHWLLVHANSGNTRSADFDVYDTGDLDKAATSISLPASLFTGLGTANSKLTLVEWSTNNNHLLIKHTFTGGVEFVVINRTRPQESFNVNKAFSVNPTEVAMRDKKVDELYIFNQNDHTLRIADTGKPSLGPVLLNRVLAFKSNGANLLTYVTDAEAPTGKVIARIWNNGKTYPLYTFSAGNIYLIDAAQFQGHWYYIAGSDTDERVNVYKDPLDDLRDPSVARARPMLALPVLGATKVEFSANTRFVAVQGGQSFAVYDFEAQTKYQYDITSPLAAPMEWMDGHRLIGLSGGSTIVMDYDSINSQSMVPSIVPEGGFFDRDYDRFFTLATSDDSQAVNLLKVDMRAGVDLPKE